jgi:hypothetical protein
MQFYACAHRARDGGRLFMRILALACASFIAACTQAAAPPQSDPMGPMPVVAGFYDSGPINTDSEWMNVWFTQELANAIEANANGPEDARLDFDFRSWANDPEVVNIRYAVGQHAEPGGAEISTRFSYPGIPGGMNLTWHMCTRADGQWRIEDITAIDVSDEPTPGAGEAITLRALLGLAPEGPCD